MRRARPDAPATRRLQQEFLGDLTDLVPRSEAAREAALRRPRRGTVADRWHVYAHGYRARLAEALELEYAAVRRILGADAFASLIGRYAAVFPPGSFDLARAGDRLAQFLEFDAATAELPFLPDLALLERAVAESFTAADASPLAWEDLRNRTPEEVAGLRLGLTPGVFMRRSVWPLGDLWRSRLEQDDEAISIPLDGRPARVLICRRAGRVHVEDVSELEAALVEAAGPGDVTLFDLQAFSGTPEDGASLRELLAAFRALVEKEVFVNKRSTGWTGALEIPKEDVS